jgi:hypothetical protein
MTLLLPSLLTIQLPLLMLLQSLTVIAVIAVSIVTATGIRSTF